MSATLTDVQVRKAKPALKPVRLFDGGGLYVEISPAGGKLWRYKYRFAKKEKLLSLGTYPDVGLAEARRKHQDARKLLAAGVDPGEARKAQKSASVVAASNSFEVLTREWHATVHVLEVSSGHAARTLTRFEQDIFPWMGGDPIDQLLAPKLLQVLRRIEARGAVETAHRAKQSCGQVFRYAIATGRAQRDPTPDLREALRPVVVEHMPAITDPVRVGELLRSIDDYRGQPVTRAALQLAPLVFVRPGELRKAEWSEVDLEQAEWRIPSLRMKRSKQDKLSGPPHVVPLSQQALAILKDLQPLTQLSRFVFPSLAHTRATNER
jgi:integrase